MKLTDPTHRFRYFSRRVMERPTHLPYHQRRIEVAQSYALADAQTEPLQGALADLFYGCWFDMPEHGQKILHELSGDAARIGDKTKPMLSPHILDAFNALLDGSKLLPHINKLATRFSVLVSPSFDMPEHRLRIDGDDAKHMATAVVARLEHARQHEDNVADDNTNVNTTDDNQATSQVRLIEEEFFAHCYACVDRIAFAKVWFELAKRGWEFDERWHACQQFLQQ